MGCVAPDELAGFVAGTLTDERYDAVLAHVDECSACRAALGEQAAVASPPHPPMASTVAATGDTARGLPVGQANSAATPGNRIDRYIVMRVIGEGGMGVVTLARDPELRRKVVIKLVRPDILAGDDTNGVRTRLMVEAQAMARVSHPNVVPIYDVGTLRDQVFIAMEYIEGSNLAQWLEQTTRKHSEILAVFRAAGRGLAAAHEAKLVHRDFKPHNVLIGKSGVVKVTDFGLARAFEAAGHAGASTGLVATTDLVLDKLQLTRTGMLLGTPAYMSPEQITGDVVDHRTDQFSFCVALYHALYRVRPFSGTTMETLLDSIQRGQLAPSKERVDPAIRAAVVRGLSANPADRFPSMTDLIAELTPRRRRLPFALVGVGIAAVVGGFAVTKLVRGGGSSDEPAAPVVASTCETDPLAELWSPARRQSVLDLGKNVGKAKLGTAIVKDVDGYVDAWRKMHRENCTSTRVEHEQPEAIMLRRDACLDQAHADLRRALDGVLLATDADRLQSSYDGVLRVRDLARCLEIGFGFALVPHEPGLLVKVNNVRIEIGRAGLLAAQLQFDEAEAHYAAQLQEARKLKYPPIEAEAQIGIGQLAMTRSRWQEAATAMTEAIQLADLGHHDDAKGKAQLALAEIMARLGKPDDADRYRRAALGSLHDAGSLAKAELDLARSLAKSLEVAGKVDEAIVQHDKAIAAAEKLYGEQPDLILVLSDKASLLQKVFRYQEALKLYERSRDLWIKRTTLAGPDGTLAKAGAAASRNQILMMLWNLGRNDEAIELGKSIIASKEDIGSTRTTLALAYADTHDEKQALEAVDASVVDASQDRKGIAYAMALLMRGVVLDRLGRHAEAEDQIRKAIAPVDSALPPDMRVVFTNALAITLVHQNKPEPAIEILTRNVATFDVWSGGDTSLLQGTIARLALAYAKGKKYDKAIETASRGLAFAGYKNPSDVGMLTFALARGTYQTDHARGLDLAKQARAAYEKINQQTRIAEIDAWIAKPE